jgi:hypothetical protein
VHGSDRHGPGIVGGIEKFAAPYPTIMLAVSTSGAGARESGVHVTLQSCYAPFVLAQLPSSHTQKKGHWFHVLHSPARALLAAGWFEVTTGTPSSCHELLLLHASLFCWHRYCSNGGDPIQAPESWRPHRPAFYFW